VPWVAFGQQEAGRPRRLLTTKHVDRQSGASRRANLRLSAPFRLPIWFPRRPKWVKLEWFEFACNTVGLMQIYRRWGLVLSLFGAAAIVIPAFAQQPDQSQQPPPAAQPSPSPPSAPAPPKPHKRKPAEAPAATPSATPAPAAAVTGGVKPTLLGQYGDWGAYTASPGGKKVCFAIAKPSISETNPPNRPRDPPYMFISSRPADKVSNEVSIIIGYTFKPSYEATLEVGSNSFALYTQQDGAWIKNAAEQAQLVDSMRTGQNAVVKGMSAKGTHTTDTFSLKGLAQALDRTDQDCK
jgi:hypothetical protein